MQTSYAYVSRLLTFFYLQDRERHDGVLKTVHTMGAKTADGKAQSQLYGSRACLSRMCK